jgi:hypothetical protein
MVFKETIADYCENHKKHTNIYYGRMQSVGILKRAGHIEPSVFKGLKVSSFVSTANVTGPRMNRKGYLLP